MLFTHTVLERSSLSLFDWDTSAVHMNASGIHHGILRMYGKLVLCFIPSQTTSGGSWSKTSMTPSLLNFIIKFFPTTFYDLFFQVKFIKLKWILHHSCAARLSNCSERFITFGTWSCNIFLKAAAEWIILIKHHFKICEKMLNICINTAS